MVLDEKSRARSRIDRTSQTVASERMPDRDRDDASERLKRSVKHAPPKIFIMGAISSGTHTPCSHDHACGRCRPQALPTPDLFLFSKRRRWCSLAGVRDVAVV